MENSHRRSESEATLVKLPVGYRFLPTDEELMAFYLRNRILDLPLPVTYIRDIDCKDLYGSPPSNIERRGMGVGQNEKRRILQELRFVIATCIMAAGHLSPRANPPCRHREGRGSSQDLPTRRPIEEEADLVGPCKSEKLHAGSVRTDDGTERCCEGMGGGEREKDERDEERETEREKEDEERE
ncbi:hypothetical protein L484_015472 [Morus notabilis]|uniref:NAC domain-containing protein n=1 Tax=Morus notabilis TaxID=981085 RepID=W9RGM0_9ROSA|nr:hypothetical protein L484_015472 [Morus notabilis]